MGQCQLGSLAITQSTLSARELCPCSVTLYTEYIKGQSRLWLQVPSDTEEELAGTGNTHLFRFPSLWKALHGLCSYCAVAVWLPAWTNVKLGKLSLPCIKLSEFSLNRTKPWACFCRKIAQTSCVFLPGKHILP